MEMAWKWINIFHGKNGRKFCGIYVLGINTGSFEGDNRIVDGGREEDERESVAGTDCVMEGSAWWK